MGVIDGVLGTRLHTRFEPAEHEDTLDELVLAEIARLEAIFSSYRADSELNRFNRGESGPPSADLRTVLDAAWSWAGRSGGAFHPATWALSQRWRDAERLGVRPGGLSTAPDDRLDLNAIAKGYIVDQAVRVAWHSGLAESVMVNLGGDLSHRGSGEVSVGVEDPRRPFDNLPPMVRLRLARGALATSGGARRGYRIDGHWFPHVLDPRTGEPVTHTLSATVVAGDTMTADALATIACVLPHRESLALVDSTPGASCLVMAADGQVLTSARWPAPARV